MNVKKAAESVGISEHTIRYYDKSGLFPFVERDKNGHRNFKVPGGKIGAWIVAGLGLISSVFAIILAIYPPAQVKKEVGSPFIYISVIVLLVAVVLLICFILYQSSQHHTNWVDPDNEFASFTWQIEGLDKPEKVSSNIPTAEMSKDQNPMEMPIKRKYRPNQKVSN